MLRWYLLRTFFTSGYYRIDRYPKRYSNRNHKRDSTTRKKPQGNKKGSVLSSSSLEPGAGWRKCSEHKGTGSVQLAGAGEINCQSEASGNSISAPLLPTCLPRAWAWARLPNQTIWTCYDVIHCWAHFYTRGNQIAACEALRLIPAILSNVQSLNKP